jgi:DnaJ-class molecular chaperone
MVDVMGVKSVRSWLVVVRWKFMYDGSIMKLKISYKPSPEDVLRQQQEKFAQAYVNQPCYACDGSGFYDWSDARTGQSPACEGCDGTGLEHPPQVVRDY